MERHHPPVLRALGDGFEAVSEATGELALSAGEGSVLSSVSAFQISAVIRQTPSASRRRAITNFPVSAPSSPSGGT